MRSLFLNLEMMLRIDDPALRGGDAPLRRRRDRAARSRSRLESHRRNRTWFNRLRWALGYFLVAVADYRIVAAAQFRDVGLIGRSTGNRGHAAG